MQPVLHLCGHNSHLVCDADTPLEEYVAVSDVLCSRCQSGESKPCNIYSKEYTVHVQLHNLSFIANKLKLYLNDPLILELKEKVDRLVDNGSRKEALDRDYEGTLSSRGLRDALFAVGSFAAGLLLLPQYSEESNRNLNYAIEETERACSIIREGMEAVVFGSGLGIEITVIRHDENGYSEETTRF